MQSYHLLLFAVHVPLLGSEQSAIGNQRLPPRASLVQLIECCAVHVWAASLCLPQQVLQHCEFVICASLGVAMYSQVLPAVMALHTNDGCPMQLFHRLHAGPGFPAT
jgi:hypothetical protein